MHVFGELLRGFRNREEVSQEELASQLNVHRQTIVNWENFKKNYRPRSQGMVEKIAEILALSPGETDQLLQAAGYPPRYSVVKQNSSQSSTQNKDNLLLVLTL